MHSCAIGGEDVVGEVKGVDSRSGGVVGRTIATICSQFRKLRSKTRGAIRLRSPMVLSTHGSARARGERAEQGAWAGRHAAQVKMPLRACAAG